ncbi:MAG: CRISPR-associated endonuclease Cas2 [bacterium]
MRDFGDQLQHSIFECQFTERHLGRCGHALSEIINHRLDQVPVVDLRSTEGRSDRRSRRARLRPTRRGAPRIIHPWSDARRCGPCRSRQRVAYGPAAAPQ